MPQQVLGGHHQQGLPELPMNLQHNIVSDLVPYSLGFGSATQPCFSFGTLQSGCGARTQTHLVCLTVLDS